MEGGRKRSPRRSGNEVWPSSEREALRVTEEGGNFLNHFAHKDWPNGPRAILRTNEGADGSPSEFTALFFLHLSSFPHKHQNIHCVSNVRDQGRERHSDSGLGFRMILFKEIL